MGEETYAAGQPTDVAGPRHQIFHETSIVVALAFVKADVGDQKEIGNKHGS